VEKTGQLQKPVLNYAVEYLLLCMAQSGLGEEKNHTWPILSLALLLYA